MREELPATERLEIDGEANLIKGVYNHVINTFGCDGQGRAFDGHFGYDSRVNGFKITTYNDALPVQGLVHPPLWWYAYSSASLNG
jgi:D-glycero-alpha-D-manno-heptose-7-phosphate kinase